MVVVLAIFGLAGGREATAATVSAGETTRSVGPGDHLCKCRSCRGAASCCCSHVEDAPIPAPASARRSAPPRIQAPDAGPCVGSAPCGSGEGIPATPAGVTIAKIATLTSTADLRPTAHDQPLVCGDAAPVPQRVPSRLDEPPELASRA